MKKKKFEYEFEEKYEYEDDDEYIFDDREKAERLRDIKDEVDAVNESRRGRDRGPTRPFRGDEFESKNTKKMCRPCIIM